MLSIIIAEVAGSIGALFTTPAIQSGWYATLVKPAFNPPSSVFGPMWTVLFALLGIALFLVWKNDWRIKNPIFTRGRRAWNPLSERLWNGDLQKQNIVALFSIQYILNILWSVVFFGSTSLTINGLNNIGLAFVVLLTLWCSIVFLIVNFYRVSKVAAWLLVPYLLWVSFAGVLNYAIWVLN